MTTSSDCYYCKKFADPAGFSPEEIVWQFPHSLAVAGPWQSYTGYCVLVSRAHAAELSQLGEHRTAYMQEMATLAEAIEKAFQPHKLNYELLGNVVPHLHWHLFPRSANDPERLKPVWLGFDAAERDPALKAKLETGSLPRAEVVARLQTELKKLGASALS